MITTTPTRWRFSALRNPHRRERLAPLARPVSGTLAEAISLLRSTQQRWSGRSLPTASTTAPPDVLALALQPSQRQPPRCETPRHLPPEDTEPWWFSRGKPPCDGAKYWSLRALQLMESSLSKLPGPPAFRQMTGPVPQLPRTLFSSFKGCSTGGELKMDGVLFDLRQVVGVGGWSRIVAQRGSRQLVVKLREEIPEVAAREVFIARIITHRSPRKFGALSDRQVSSGSSSRCCSSTGGSTTTSALKGAARGVKSSTTAAPVLQNKDKLNGKTISDALPATTGDAILNGGNGGHFWLLAESGIIYRDLVEFSSKRGGRGVSALVMRRLWGPRGKCLTLLAAANSVGRLSRLVRLSAWIVAEGLVFLLQELHSRGILFGDAQPGNFALVAKQQDGGVGDEGVVLCGFDFGRAVDLPAFHGLSGAVPKPRLSLDWHGAASCLAGVLGPKLRKTPFWSAFLATLRSYKDPREATSVEDVSRHSLAFARRCLAALATQPKPPAAAVQQLRSALSC